MFHPGLVSITFRKLTAAEIVDLVARSGLEGIEWGGDVHVPHGDVERAEQVRQITQDAGLTVSSYGSYYRVAESEQGDGPRFEQVLETAVALGTSTIRVWAGAKNSEDADEAYWGTVVADSRRIADLADQAGVDIAYEFHGGTLTNTGASARRLLQELNHAHIKQYWQPSGQADVARRLADLDAVLPWLSNIHAFYWDPNFANRRPLAAGYDQWRKYLQRASSTGRDHWVLIEFVRGDNLDQFLADAETLLRLLEETV